DTGELVRYLTRAKGVAVAQPNFEEPWCVTTGDEGEVIQWNLETGEEVKRLVGHTASVIAVAISNDNKHILTGGTDDTLRLWNRKTGELLRAITGHDKFVMGVAFLPTGRQAVSSSFDG